jgi:single-strand DNA-binding protein
MNETHVTVTGWTGADPVLDTLASGQQVATFRLASTPRRMRDGEWVDDETLWFTVKCWRHLAGHVATSVRKGEPVVVQGRLVADSWKRDDGTVTTRFVIVAAAVGHDLAHGTTAFRKRAAPVQEAAA